MLSWHHSSFQAYIGDGIYPSDKTGLGNLARYIVRACFSQERMIYVPDKESDDGVAKLVCTAYEVDPLLYPKCQGTMKIISFIEDLDIIEKTLRHLDLWDTRNHDPPEPEPSHIPELVYDYSDSQIPAVDYWN